MKFLDKLSNRRGWLGQLVSITVAVATTDWLFAAAGIERAHESFALLAIRVLCMLMLDRIVATVLDLVAAARRTTRPIP